MFNVEDKPETDTLEGLVEGYHVYARRNGGQMWCGYVEIEQGHPWWDRADDDYVDVDVHGGCTYLKRQANGRVRIGFDCAHWCDAAPPWASAVLGEAGVYRNLAYVEEQIRSLVCAAKAASEAGRP